VDLAIFFSNWENGENQTTIISGKKKPTRTNFWLHYSQLRELEDGEKPKATVGLKNMLKQDREQ
jgi:hypothetical protein